MPRWPFQAFLPCLILLAGCEEKALVIQGQVSQVPVGGFSCWLLTSTERKTYVLLNADPTMQREGLRVAVTGQLRKGSHTPCQVGLPFEVESYRTLKD